MQVTNKPPPKTGFSSGKLPDHMATHGVPVAKAVKDPATRDMNAPTYHDASLRKMLTDFFLCCISYLKIRLMMDAFIPLFSVRSKHQ